MNNRTRIKSDFIMSLASFGMVLGLVAASCSSHSLEGDATEDTSTADSVAADTAVDEGDELPPGVNCESITCPSGMVEVPCGPFVMGSDPDEGTGDVFAREMPEHIVYLSNYCMDIHEVTNAEWKECVSAGACEEPLSYSIYTVENYYLDEAYADHPVVNTVWDQAQNFCSWKGKRLATEAEWEKAARGGCELVAPDTCGPEDERRYPWGDGTPTCDISNFMDCHMQPVAVGSYPGGVSPYGIYDMSGNAAEWVSDWFDPSYYSMEVSVWVDPVGPTSGEEKSIRDMGWDDWPEDNRIPHRYGHELTVGGYAKGLRCAYSE